MNCSVKKRYTAPSLESIAIDQEIALVMMTNPTVDCEENPELCGTSSLAPSAKSSSSLKKASPFGGTRPNYQ